VIFLEAKRLSYGGNRPKSVGGVSRSRQLRQEAERKNGKQPRQVSLQQEEEYDNGM
jgi:hypothetical protein